MAPMTQVGAQYEPYGDRRGPVGPARWKKKMEGHPSTCRDTAHLRSADRRMEPRRNWLLGGFAAAFAMSCGMAGLGGFAGAAQVHVDEVNDLVSRSRHLVSAALPVPCAFSSASGPPLAAPLAVLAGGTTTRDPRPPAGPKSRKRACSYLGLGRLSREPAGAVLSSTPGRAEQAVRVPLVVG